MDFDTYIEIPARTTIKYEVDEKTGELRVDRFLHTGMYYPFNYGYIKDTLGEDSDPIDVVILSSESVVPGVVMKCHSIGILQMEDEEGIDTKVIAVPDVKVDPEYGDIKNIKDVNESTLKKVKHFFEHYKGLEPGKWVKIGEFEDRAAAEKLVEQGKESFKKKGK